METLLGALAGALAVELVAVAILARRLREAQRTNEALHQSIDALSAAMTRPAGPRRRVRMDGPLAMHRVSRGGITYFFPLN